MCYPEREILEQIIYLNFFFHGVVQIEVSIIKIAKTEMNFNFVYCQLANTEEAQLTLLPFNKMRKMAQNVITLMLQVVLINIKNNTCNQNEN